ncbi:MAG: GldG family protein [Ruminococcus sp.]|nr:GldG family protein [Ruminococcus sp.]
MADKKKKKNGSADTSEKAADNREDNAGADAEAKAADIKSGEYSVKETEADEKTESTAEAQPEEPANISDDNGSGEKEASPEKKPEDKERARKRAFNRRKLKYGSVAAAITVVVIAAVVMINVVFDMASEKINMSVDLTSNSNFEISQQTIDYLATVNEPVSIVCLSDELTFQTSAYIYYKQAYEVLKKYSIYNDNITLTFVDMVKNPTYAERYKSVYKGDISQYSIIVESDKRIKVLGIQDLYNTETQFDYSSFTTYEVPVSSKAEQELTSAVMYVTDPDPISAVIFNSPTEGTSYENVQSLLISNGYEVSEIDPLAGQIPEDADVIVINAPLNDYDEYVVDMLYDFLDNGGNLGRSLIYIADMTQKDTGNIDAFLAEWGIKVESGIVGEQDPNFLQSSNNFVIKDYISENDYSVNVPQISLPVVDYYSRPITLLFDSKDTRTTVPLLRTSETGFVFNEEMRQAMENGEEPELAAGVNTTMALGRKYIFDKDNNMIFSNVLVIGSAETLDETYTSKTFYNNGDYFISVLNTMTGKNSGVSIVAKDLSSPAISVDQGDVNKYFTLFIIVIPAAVLAAGVVVFIKRRSK